MQYGLSVVKPKQQKQRKERTMSDREYRAYAKGKSWKMDLEITVDECMAQARSREHFIRLMEYNGYEVKWTDSRKNITYTTPDGNKCCDDKMNGLLKRNASLAKEINQLQSAEADLLRQQGEGDQKKQPTAQIIPTTQHILDNYDTLTIAEKNRLWKLVMPKATVYRSPGNELTVNIYPNLPM